MGIVYAAEQVEPRRRVALKILLPRWVENSGVRERFRREAQAMAGLEHEAILPVYAVGETDGLPWFTMKLATGGSLAQRGPEFACQWAKVAELVARLADALGHAHERGVLHRDEHLPALLRRMSDEPPRPLGDFTPAPPRDLRAICEKAMAREPEHRYATARGLADDLGRFLRGELVHAREGGPTALVARWCRRHPAVASLLALVFVLTTALAVGSTVAAMTIRRAEQVAVAARDRAEASLRQSRLAEAEGLRRARQPRFRQQALERVLSAGAPGESAEMRVDRRSEAIAALALPAMHPWPLPVAPLGCTLAAMAQGHGFIAWHVTRGDG
ncbi:MAG: hypothetical protein EXS36_04770 [Pedosphaera sp.]|nr:hypothetical protein [Pedosphaera sp.]